MASFKPRGVAGGGWICHNTATSTQLGWDLGWAWQYMLPPLSWINFRHFWIWEYIDYNIHPWSDIIKGKFMHIYNENGQIKYFWKSESNSWFRHIWKIETPPGFSKFQNWDGEFSFFLHIFLFSDYDTSPETTTSLISFTWVETDTYWQIEWKNFESVYCQTPNLGLGLGVDFTFPNRGLKFGTQTKLAIVSSW